MNDMAKLFASVNGTADMSADNDSIIDTYVDDLKEYGVVGLGVFKLTIEEVELEAKEEGRDLDELIHERVVDCVEMMESMYWDGE